MQHLRNDQNQHVSRHFNNLTSSIKRTSAKRQVKSIVALAISSAVFCQAHADSQYDSLTFFGDSLTDGGYFQPISQQTPGVSESGQFTTNPDDTWATHFAEQLGFEAIANTFGRENAAANNYAIGGARAGIDITNSNFGLEVPVASASSQIDQYLANNTIDPNGLYVVWAGANDLLAAARDTATAQDTIAAAVNSQVSNIKKLSDSGANHILVPNIPDIGLTPDVVGTPAQAPSTLLTSQFNQAMLDNAAQIDANVIPLDTFSLIQELVKSPATYGFENVTDKACITTSSLVCGTAQRVTPNANETYFFADAVHPTGRAHKMIADYANAVVAAPKQIGILPYLVASGGSALSDQVQTHINQTHYKTRAVEGANRVWAVGDLQSTESDDLESSGDAQLLLGMDFSHTYSPYAVSGIYGHLTKKEFDHNGANSGLSNIDLDEVGVGVYHSNSFATLGGLQLSGALGFSALDVDVMRAVTLSNYTQQLKAGADGKRYYANLQAGYPMQMNNMGITPYLGASVNRVSIDALKESALPGIAMQFDKQKYTLTQGRIGVKANRALSDTLSMFGDTYYQTQLSDDMEDVTARINTLPNHSFNTAQSAIDEDNVGITLGLSQQFSQFSAQAGVSHINGDDTETTRVFVEVAKAF